MNPTDAAVLSVLGRGGVQDLLNAGFDWQMMEDPDAKVVAQEAMSLHIQSRPVNLTNVMLRLDTVQDWRPVMRAWTDGYGSTAYDAASKVKLVFLRRQFNTWMIEVSELARTSPDMKWLPGQVAVAQSLVQKGTPYSPKPTAHVAKPIPEIFRPFEKPTLNELFRGGIWKPGFFGFAAPSMGGKTTMAVTIASECSAMGIRNVIVSSEIPEQGYVYRVMRTFGFSKSEFTTYAHGNDGTPRAQQFHGYLATLDTSLSVYGADFMEAKRIGAILAIERPDVLQIDHLLAMRLASRRTNDSSAMGELVYELQDFGNRYGCMIIVYGQLSDENATTFLAKHDLPFVKFFGSAIVNQALRWAALTCRHWDMPDVQYLRVKKNNIEESGEVDTEHFMRYDKALAAYVERGEGNV